MARLPLEHVPPWTEGWGTHRESQHHLVEVLIPHDSLLHCSEGILGAGRKDKRKDRRREEASLSTGEAACLRSGGTANWESLSQTLSLRIQVPSTSGTSCPTQILLAEILWTPCTGIPFGGRRACLLKMQNPGPVSRPPEASSPGICLLLCPRLDCTRKVQHQQAVGTGFQGGFQSSTHPAPTQASLGTTVLAPGWVLGHMEALLPGCHVPGSPT